MTKLNKVNFSLEVERLSASDDISFIDALVSVCDKHNIDYADVSRHEVDGVFINLITKPLKEKIEAECINVRLIKGKHSSPSVLDFL